MNSTLKSIISIVFLGFTSLYSLDSQAQNYGSEKNTHIQLSDSLEGMYQIQMINVRYQPTIDTDVLKSIRDNQSTNQDVFLSIANNIRVKILSKNNVSNGLLYSEDERIVYLNE